MAAKEGGTAARGGRAGRLQGLDIRVINQRARQLVIRLNLLFRTAAIHEVNNDALQRSVEFLIQAANELYREFSPVVLQGDQDQMYLSDFRIKGDATVYQNIRTLVAELKRYGAGGVTIHQEITRADVLGLLEVLRSFQGSAGGEEGYQRLNEALAGRGVSAISFNRYLELSASGDLGRHVTRSKQTHALKTYAKIIVAMRRVIGRGEDLKPLDRLKLIKNVQTLVDLCHDDELFFSGLNSLKTDSDYASFHPVHVAMLSIQMGKHIGLPKRHLMDLGLAALFYDIGRVKLGAVQLEKPQSLTAEEWDAVRRHPLRSAREILRARTLTEAVRKRLVVAFEHHLWMREGGYPQRIHTRPPHLFSRIVGIADTYDALTTARPHRDGYLPNEALRIMLDDAGRKYDPTLLKVLINILQVYPMGTLVLLDSGEIGSVYHSHSDPELKARPIVRLLTDEKGRQITPRLGDLTEKGADGAFLRTIVRALDPEDTRAFLGGGAA